MTRFDPSMMIIDEALERRADLAYQRTPRGRGWSVSLVLTPEGVDEAVAAANAVRAEFAVRAGDRSCRCSPAPILDRTPGALLRQALDPYPLDPCHDSRAAIDDLNQLMRDEGRRYTARVIEHDGI